MTLSELIGEQPVLSAEERAFLEHTNRLWAQRFGQIVKESKKEPKRGRV